MLETLTTKLETVDSQLNTLSRPSKSTPKEPAGAGKEMVEKTEEECNREYLKTLDEEKVQILSGGVSNFMWQLMVIA
jgi:hypothetical protein